MLKFLLKSAETTWDKVTNILATVGFFVLYVHLVRFLFLTSVGEEWELSYHWTEWSWYDFAAGCIAAPLWEEFLFRKLPLDFVGKWGNDDLLLQTVFASSLLFGLVHGGPFSVFIQGVGGLLFAFLYVKNGYSYWSTVIAHFLWNFIIMFWFPYIYK